MGRRPLIKQEYQTRLHRERLHSRIQVAQMWNDDGQGWVEDEQLRLDGVESWLLDTLEDNEKQSWVLIQLARLDDRQTLVDLVGVLLEDTRVAKLTPEQRREVARKAAAARWNR